MDEATFVLTHDNPSGAGTSGTIQYTVELVATDRAGNDSLTIVLPPFIPDLGGDQAGLNATFVESVQEVPFPGGVAIPPGSTGFAFEITASEDEQVTPGVVGFDPADDMMVLITVTKENLTQMTGEPGLHAARAEWRPVDDASHSLPNDGSSGSHDPGGHGGLHGAQ